MRSIRNLRNVVFLLVAVCMLSSVTVYGKPYYKKNVTVYNFGNNYQEANVIRGVSSRNNITRLKSSNKKVLRVHLQQDSEGVWLWLKPKKQGVSNVTFRVKEDGETYNLKSKVHVWKYKNPFSKLKVGKKDYKSKFNNTDEVTVYYDVEGKLDYKLKKGWKVVESSQYYQDGDNFTDKALKNKSKITLYEGDSIFMRLRYKGNKNHEEEFYLHVK